ncbi:MAG: efflux RND transporter periplasmic adaptor subunit [Deltaproteobacteria bacterium]|jgi:RND family efflux transporter MFP subunit|nr:efflux RND transporter periplasmic adaptor subunit [Deltaproteobacteria bacterium]
MTDKDSTEAGPRTGVVGYILRHKVIFCVVALFIALTAVRLSGLASIGPGYPGFGAKEPIYVELADASHGTMRNLSRYYGTLYAPNRFQLSAKVGGEVLEILKDIGDRLESGELVAVLDDEEYGLAKERAALSVGLAEAQLAEAKANLELAKNDMARQSNLSKKSIVTQSEYEAAENRLLQAEARLNVAASQLQSAINQLADAELRLSYTKVKASWPEDAEGGYRYVGQRLVDTGTLVVANTPILELVSLDPLLVVVEVMEKDYPKISVGMEAALAAEAYPGESFSGRVARVAPVLSADSRQARVELEVKNPGLRLKPGMFAEVVFVFEEKQGVWSVAQDVPFRRHDGYVIFVADPATMTVEERPVTLGLVEGDRVELVGSAPIDGPVVVLGQHLLTDGQAYRLPGDMSLNQVQPAAGRPQARPAKGGGVT